MSKRPAPTQHPATIRWPANPMLGINAAKKTIPLKKRKLNSTNQQALRTGGWANPTRGGELKFKDTNISFNTPIAGTGKEFTPPGSTNLLNGLVPGSSAEQRIGRKVIIKSVLIRYAVSLADTSTGGSPIRMMVFYDKQANAAYPAVTDMLLADAFTSQNNLSNRDRFVTIFDLITDPVCTANNQTVAGTLYKSVNLETMFNAGNAGTIGDITSGSIYIIAAQVGTVKAAPPIITVNCRVRYTDV